MNNGNGMHSSIKYRAEDQTNIRSDNDLKPDVSNQLKLNEVSQPNNKINPRTRRVLISAGVILVVVLGYWVCAGGTTMQLMKQRMMLT